MILRKASLCYVLIISTPMIKERTRSGTQRRTRSPWTGHKTCHVLNYMNAWYLAYLLHHPIYCLTKQGDLYYWTELDSMIHIWKTECKQSLVKYEFEEKTVSSLLYPRPDKQDNLSKSDWPLLLRTHCDILPVHLFYSRSNTYTHLPSFIMSSTIQLLFHYKKKRDLGPKLFTSQIAPE